MDDILQQAIGQAGITDAPNSTNQRQLQPRPISTNQCTGHDIYDFSFLIYFKSEMARILSLVFR